MLCKFHLKKKKTWEANSVVLFLLVRNLIPHQANNLFKVTQAFLSSQGQESASESKGKPWLPQPQER